jgi:hypothetical protein
MKAPVPKPACAVAPHGQGFKDLGPSVEELERLVLQGRLNHGGNPLLRWCLANVAIETDPTGAKKPAKNRSRGRIDPLVAAIMAVGQAAREPRAASRLQRHGDPNLAPGQVLCIFVVGEQDRSRTVQDNEQDSEDLTTAAQRLGLTVETVRKRLQRGKIKGFKTADGTWRVALDRVDKRQDSSEQATGQEQDKPGQDTDPLTDPLVETLRDEVRFLRSQLQVRDEDVRRVHVLLQQEQQKTLLPRLDSEEKDVPNAAEDDMKVVIKVLEHTENILPIVIGGSIILLMGFAGSSWAELSKEMKIDIMNVSKNMMILLIFSMFHYFLFFIKEKGTSVSLRLLTALCIALLYAKIVDDFRVYYLNEVDRPPVSSSKEDSPPPQHTLPIEPKAE